MKIYKYELVGPNCVLHLPRGCRILSTGIQRPAESFTERIVVWALVDPKTRNTDAYHFSCLNTGADVDAYCDEFPKHTFLGTLTSSNGIVWHVFYMLM